MLILEITLQDSTHLLREVFLNQVQGGFVDHLILV